MAATTLSAGDIAIIGYQADSPDSLSFVLLHDIGSGTQIFFSDRNWNGTAFPGAGSGDGTATFTAGADMAAGTVITINAASLSGGGSTFDHTTGDTIYAYQGTNANTPTTFLYAVDFADGNTTFNGNLTGTGLTNGVNAVAVPFDNASYAGPSTYQAGLQLSTGTTLLTDISNFNEWIGNDNAGQTALVQPPQGVFLDAPEVQIWTVGSGGGEVIAHVDNNNGANSGSDLVQLLTNKTINIVRTGGTTPDAAGLRGPQDIALDPVHNRYFVLDSDGTNDRILEGNLSDLLNNPGQTQTLRELYAQAAVGDGGTGLTALTVDPNNGILYFIETGGTTGNDFRKITYSTTATPSTVGQTPVTLGSIGVEGTNFPQDMAIDFVNGDVIITDGTTFSVFTSDAVFTNYIWRATGLTSSSGAGSLTFSKLNFAPDDDDAGAPNNPNIPGLGGEAFPAERGVVFGVDIDPVTRTLYFTTESVALDTSAAQDGSQITTFFGGVWSYALTGNATGVYTNIYQQNGVTGVTALLHYIEVDQSGNYYVTGKGTGSEAIYIDSVVAGGAVPTVFSPLTNINALGPHGIVVEYAPTLALALGATPTYTETAGTPSAAGTAVSLNITATANDIDAVDVDEDLAGAIVRISSNFLSGASHQDFLTVNGDADGVGTIGGSGINFSYNSTLGVLTLSGTATFAEYKAALELVQFTSSGDNPTDYGAKNNRTISWSVNDGLLSSSEQNSTINITAVNDNPVNGSLPTLNGAGSVTEDTGKQITFTVSDPDADPANQNITVRLQVTQGTIDINTAVAGGLSAGQVTGDNTNDVLLTGTQNQINATLANATGAVYHNIADYNGADTLTITTNDLGNTGTPGATTDVDNITININAVVDIANDTPTIAEDAGPTTIDVLANDTFENPGRAITAVGTASHGTVVINNNSTPGDATDDFIVYTSTADYNGADSFTYTVTSGGVTEQATVNVTITAVADIVNDIVIVNEDSGANSLDLLANDNFENPSRAITAVGAALHGTTTINNNGTAGDATDDFVVYTPNANYNGSDTFTYTVTSPAGVTEQATVNVTVNAVNDPVTTNAPPTATLAEDSVNFAVTGLSISDVDAALAPAGVYEVTLSATQGLLTMTTLTGLTFTSGDGTADTTMTFHGTLSDINTALATAKYSPNANYNGSAQISLQATDTFGGIVATGSGLATSDSDTINVTVTAVNDPVTGTAPANLSATEDGGSVAVTGLLISDVDATLAPAGVYSVTLSASQGTLTLSTTTGLTFDTGDGAADATMTFHGTLSDINTAVATATYAPNSNFNGSDTIVFAVTDTFGGIVATGTGLATSDSDNVAVTVSAVNDPVTSNAPANASVVEDVATAITGLSISDVDATLAPAGVYEVTLAATNGTLTMTTLAGLTFTVGDGTADATMTFHGTLSAINTALATASYTSASNFNGSAQVSINVTDTFGGIVATGTGLATSDSDTINVTVSAANDPVTSSAPANASGDEDAGPIAITGLSIADVDATLAPAGIYSVTLSATNGTLTLTTLTGLTFTGGSDGTADATMTFTGTLANINTALATASYTPASNFAGPATVLISVTDDVGGTIATGSGIATSDSDNVNVTVNAVNDPPAAVIDQASYLGTPSVAIDLKGELSVSDIDAAAGSVTVTLSVNSATAVLTVTAGGSGVLPANITGSGTNSVTITGTVAQIDNLFNTDGTSTVTFVDSTGGSKTLTLAIDDNGFTGSPGNLTAQDTANILLDEPPVISNVGQTVNYVEQQPSPVVVDNDLTLADPDAPGAGNQINSATAQITAGFVTGDELDADTTGTSISAIWNAGTQTLELTGADTLANYQQVLRTVTFQSSSDDPTNASRTITWIAKDIFDAPSAPVTSTVSVTPVNDEPTLTAPAVDPIFTEGGAAADIFTTPIVANTIEAGQTFASLTLTVTNVTDGAGEIVRINGVNVALTDGNSVNVTVGTATVALLSGTATVTVSGLTLSPAQLQTLVDGLAYSNTSDDPTDANRVVTITQVVDSGANGGVNNDDSTTALSIVSTVNVDPVNDEPTLTATAANATFTEGGAPADIFTAPIVANTIEAGQTFSSLTLTITNVTDGASELLRINGTDVALTDTNSVATGVGQATVSLSGSTATVTLTGATLDAAALQGLIDGFSYINTSQDPTDANRLVTITQLVDSGANGGVNNDDNTAAPGVSSTVNVDPVNDEPTLTATGASSTYAENSAPATLFSAAAASTIETGQTFTSMTLTVSGLADGANELLFIDGSNVALTNGNVVVTATNGLTVNVSVAGSTATVSFTGASLSQSALQTLVNALGYSNTDDTPTETSRTVTITQLVDSGSNAAPNDNTAALGLISTVGVTATNDAPVLTGVTDTPAFTENGSSVLLDTNGNAAVSDPELNAAGNYAGATLTLQRSGGPNLDDSFAATGTLDLVDVNGLGENVSLDGGATFIGTFVDNGDGSISFTFNANATAADINSVMRQIVYGNVSDNPPTTVPIDFIFNDGNGLPGGQAQGTGAGVTTATVNVQVTQVDDAPVLLNVAPGAAYTIGSAGVILSSALGVFDIDATPPSTLTGIASATIKIETGFFAGDQLFVNLPTSGGFFIVDDGGGPVVTNISVASNALGQLVLTGQDSVGHYQAVLDAVSYRSIAVDPSNGGLNPTRTISWVVNDGALNSQTPNLDENNLVNATILHFDVPPALDLDASGAGTGFTTSFTENGAAVAIVDTDLSITDPDNTTLDKATIVLTNAKAGDVLSVVGALPFGIDSSIDTSVAGQITLTLANSASIADYMTALGQVRFSNSSDNPDTTDRDITVQVGVAEATSNTSHATVHVVPVNDAPLNTVPGAQSAIPNTNKVIAGLAVSDIDANSGSLTTTLSVLHGILTVSSSGGAGVAGSGTASVTLTGTLAQINTTLSAANNIVYKSDAAFNGSDTLTVLTNDGGNTGTGGAHSDSDNVTIVVSAPPTITSNGGGDTATVNILERTNAVTTVTATDPDSPSLTFSIIGGSDSGKFQINASTGALSFKTAPNFDVPADTDHNNSYIVQVQASDGVLTDNQTLTVQVTDNPSITSTVHWIKSVDPGVHPAGWNPAGLGDFNGDGTTDLAWFNPTTGNLDIWKLSNGGWAGSSNVGSHPLGYQPVGFGDYNGDHTNDVLWYNPTTRDVDLWKISNGQWAGSVNIGTHPAGFTPSLSGDFNGDGTSDILWFNPTTNAVDIWKIDSNGNWAGSVNLGTHPAGFTPALAGDFNGDGTSDVLWYNPTNGQVDIWNLSNAQWAGSVNVGAHPLGWQPLGAADFNLDGTSDVAWHNPTTNNIEVWLIENSAWSETANIGSHPPSAVPRGGLLPTPPQFVPVVAVGVGDFDHNGVADVMWQDTNNKHIDNWLLDYS
jgi:hypothetical protein